MNLGIHSFFLSAQECITAAYFQSLNPNPSKHSPTGYFGSKFATVIVTGKVSNLIRLLIKLINSTC